MLFFALFDSTGHKYNRKQKQKNAYNIKQGDAEKMKRINHITKIEYCLTKNNITLWNFLQIKYLHTNSNTRNCG